MTFEPPPHALTEAGRKVWDVIVIGAGPAGALASDLLSRGGLSVLLVDAKPFCRSKICGGCLNAVSLDILDRCSLNSVLDCCSAIPLESIQISSPRQELKFALTGKKAVNRTEFDAALVEASVRSGTEYYPEVTAQVLSEHDGQTRRVLLRHDSQTVEATSRIVFCADGLTQSSLRSLPEFTSEVAKDSRFGLGATFSDAPDGYPAGELTMAWTSAGYAGVTRCGDGALTIAAALDAKQMSQEQSAGAAIGNILQSCRLQAPATLEAVHWHGTPALTRKSNRVSSSGLLVIGDAAGYVEPFTGEGIGFALLSAILAAPLTLQHFHQNRETLTKHWEDLHQRKVVRNQWVCRLLTRILRSSALTSCTLGLCKTMPLVRRSVMSQLNKVPTRRLPPIARSSKWS